jgi:hypothetical protein
MHSSELQRQMRKALLSLTVFALLLPPVSSAVVIGDIAYSQPITIGVVQQTSDYSLARGANLGWVRVTFAWRDINPAYGVFNWGPTDGNINDARSRGLKVLAILSTAPTWAGSNDKGTTPPGNISYWEEFVHQVAQHYAGRVEAYEIWNEPDLTNSGDGVGWNANLWASPRYVDYLHSAAKNIRAYAPGTLVVGPATSSQPNANTVEVFKQLQQVTFPDGPASSFLDVVSFHANANNDESTQTVLDRITSQLGTLANRNPSNLRKPIWLTELGWKSSRVGEPAQRDRIRNIVTALRGSGGYIPDCYLCPPAPQHSAYKWTHVFIYKDVDSPTENSGIYRLDKTPKPVVTDYLWTLPFPAKHLNDEYTPFTASCSGRTCTFSSSSAYGTVHWDFGDGTTSTGVVTTHTFLAAGQYFVAQGAEVVGPGGSDVRLIRVY